MAPITSFVSLCLLVGLAVGTNKAPCRYIPGDKKWPLHAAWKLLNETVHGRLIETVPMPSVCHYKPFGTFDVEGCEEIRSTWTDNSNFIESPAEVMNPYFQNQTCDPFTPASKPCQLGNYASYSIKVTGADDVIAGIRFAKERNIRLVIKNTGHEFAGKSTGKGSLSLWTHNLNSIDIIKSYKSKGYKGPAVKLGAGVIAGDVYAVVGAAGYRILGGSCPTVGLAGGYTSGGGHSLLNGAYGMAADAVLEWEVVTAQGKHLTATPTKNSDLYWALSGGGAGTFAVVLSMTTKIFPDGPIGGGRLTFDGPADDFWGAIGDLFEYLPRFVDAGPNTWDFEINQQGFAGLAITAPDKNATEVAALLQPYMDALDGRGIDYEFTPDDSPTYSEHFEKLFGPLPWGVFPSNIQLASRLIPRDAVLDSDKNKAITNAMRPFVDNEHWSFGCHGLNVKDIERPDNAVLPAWRDAIALCNIVSVWDWEVPWTEMQARKELLVDTLIPGLEAATPGAGTYLNEIDARWKGDWKEELYGANYPRLLKTKEKYDPEHVFYAWTAVGSDFWVEDGRGRLCRA